MRPLELTLFLLDLGCVVLPLLARPDGAVGRWLAWLAPLACLTALAQLVVERYRWQMVPLYALTVVLLALALPRLLGRAPAQQRRRRAWAGALRVDVVLGIAATPPVLFPAPLLPAP